VERGVVEAGTLACAPATIRLRPARVSEVMGIDIPPERQHAILTGLGFVDQGTGQAGGAEDAGGQGCRWQAPTWRRDVWREIDLVEEIARIEGYGKVPENWPISARPVELSPRERTIRTASAVLASAGLCEAMTRSVVSAALEATASPWGVSAPLVVAPALVRGADRLRRTLLPSLLEARAGNMAAGATHAELFEIARAYLGRSAAGAHGESPVEEPLLAAIVTGGSFFVAKGLAEAVLGQVGVAGVQPSAAARIEFKPVVLDLFTPGRAAEIVLTLDGKPAERMGVVGEFSAAVLDRFDLDGPVAGVELRLDRLEFAADAERKLRRPSDFPAIERDINLVVDDAVSWGSIAATIRDAAGTLLEHCRLTQVWKDADRLGAGKKSVVVTLRLRSDTGTLSGEEANRAVQAIVDACTRSVGAVLRG